MSFSVMRLKLALIMMVFFGLTSPQDLFGLNFSISVDSLTNLVDGTAAPYNQLQPGDTILFKPGRYNYILIRNFTGSASKPIIFKNKNGVVSIDTDHYYGISIQNCRYIRLTGTGDKTNFYGFKISRVKNGSGVGVGVLSSDIEIDHVSIENTSIGGIYAKTDPDCTLTSVRGTFTQYNTVIHDNYIANAGNEALYIGSTKFSGQTVICNGKETTLLPSLLDGVKVYNNIIKYSGWDGIQVSSAFKNCKIYNNTVLFDSQAEYENQMSGIIIGGGSKCDCYNNYISDGKGVGIESHGLGGYRIYNNLIVNAGLSFEPFDKTHMKHGIFVSDVSTENDSSFYIQHNNIINPKSDGIRFSSIKSKKNIIASNVIINPGNFDYYENGNTSFKGKDAYIMFQSAGTDATLPNNYLSRNGTLAGFASQNMHLPDDFRLVAGSPLIDAADVDKKIGFDYLGFSRPFGVRSDIGAYEFGSTISGIDQIETNEKLIRLLQNPVNDFLTIIFPEGSIAEVILNIYNLEGQLVGQFKLSELPSESPAIYANISDLSAGTYIYSVRSADFRSSGKFIKW